MVLEKHKKILYGYVSVQDGAQITGYSQQYLRRLLRSGKIKGLKIGSVWLIKYGGIQEYNNAAKKETDLRYGPKS